MFDFVLSPFPLLAHCPVGGFSVSSSPSFPAAALLYDGAAIRGHGGEVIVVVIVYPPEG